VKVLLDTNAYVALRRGHAGVVDAVRNSSGIVFSAVVAGELLHGFYSGTRTAANLRDFEAFLDQPEVAFLPVSWVTADRFGRIASALKRKGQPIPSNDIWIAAQALETGANLVSLDRHFAQVDGLAWVFPEP
jgi:tRNA(fMet)-specific endonuclease VapC